MGLRQINFVSEMYAHTVMKKKNKIQKSFDILRKD